MRDGREIQYVTGKEEGKEGESTGLDGVAGTLYSISFHGCTKPPDESGVSRYRGKSGKQTEIG